MHQTDTSRVFVYLFDFVYIMPYFLVLFYAVPFFIHLFIWFFKVLRLALIVSLSFLACVCCLSYHKLFSDMVLHCLLSLFSLLHYDV